MNNLRYAVTESPHMWSILAGISGLATLIGTMAIIIYDWSHVLARVYFYLGLALTLCFLVMALLDWKNQVEESIAEEDRRRNRRAQL
jgi:hypothetical protein